MDSGTKCRLKKVKKSTASFKGTFVVHPYCHCLADLRTKGRSDTLFMVPYIADASYPIVTLKIYIEKFRDRQVEVPLGPEAPRLLKCTSNSLYVE